MIRATSADLRSGSGVTGPHPEQGLTHDIQTRTHSNARHTRTCEHSHARPDFTCRSVCAGENFKQSVETAHAHMRARAVTCWKLHPWVLSHRAATFVTNPHASNLHAQSSSPVYMHTFSPSHCYGLTQNTISHFTCLEKTLTCHVADTHTFFSSSSAVQRGSV